MATVNEKMTAIADAIRKKIGGTELFTLDDMAIGVNEVYETGQKVYNEDFWRRLLQGGKRENLSYLFAYADFTGYTIPNDYGKISVAVESFQRLFRFYKGTEIPKGLDVSKALPTASTQNMFSDTNLVLIPDIGLPAMTAYSDSFSTSQQLVTIEVLRCTEETTFSNNVFGTTPRLRNITIEGIIGKSIRFAQSPLSVDSLKSIITHLKDFIGTDSEYTCTVTFKTSAFDELEASDEKAPNGNTWAEYIDDLKWNLVKA